VVRHGETASRIEGAELTRFMATLNEYLGFCGEGGQAHSQRKTDRDAGARRTDASAADFSAKDGKGVPDKIAGLHSRLVELADEFQFKVNKPVEDEEHHTWSVCYTDTRAPRVALTGRWLPAPSSAR